MATTNYGLEEINKQTDIISPDPINRNMVKIDKQIKTNEQAIQSVSEQISTINVTSDVEEVIDRRVNSDRLKSLNTLIGEIKDAIVTTITGARDNIKSHVTSEHTTTKNKVNTDIISARDNIKTHITSEHTTTKSKVSADIISARDSINSNVDTEATSIRSAITDLKQHVSNGKKLIATAITDKGITATSSDTLVTLASKIGQISPVPSSMLGSDGGLVSISTASKSSIPTTVGNALETNILSVYSFKGWAKGDSGNSNMSFKCTTAIYVNGVLYQAGTRFKIDMTDTSTDTTYYLTVYNPQRGTVTVDYRWIGVNGGAKFYQHKIL